MNYKNIIMYFSMGIALLFVMCPAQAFTADHIDYAISSNGDATVTADYSLSFVEKIALGTDTIKGEFTKALKNEYGENAEVVTISDTRTVFTIKGFADVKDGYLMTPCLNFEHIKSRVESYWFLKYLNIDFSPTITTVSFYNSEVYTYNDVLFIPAITFYT